MAKRVIKVPFEFIERKYAKDKTTEIWHQL